MFGMQENDLLRRDTIELYPVIGWNRLRESSKGHGGY